MRRMTALLGAVAVMCVSAWVLAQAVPNFAGKWTLVPDANAQGGRGGFGGGLGMEAVIAQDAKTLTITRTTQAGEIKSVYNLDGSESKNSMNFGGNSMEQLSKVTIDGSAVVIATHADFGGTPFDTTMKLSLDASGQLIVESTVPDVQGGGAPTTVKRTYKK